MTIQTQSADGTIHEFPDGTPQENIDKAMKAYAQQQPKPPSETTRVLSSVNERIAGALGLPVDLARSGLEAVGVPVAPAEKQFGGSESIRRAMRFLGMSREGAEPETTAGKFAASTMGATAETALTGAGIGGAIKKIGTTFGRPVLEQLGEQFGKLGPNVVAGAGAGAGGEAAEKTGMPREIGEIVGAGAAGFASPHLKGPSTSLRSGTPRAPRDPVLDAYERLNLQPTAAEVGMGGQSVRLLQSNILPQTLGGSNVMENFRVRRLTELTELQNRLADAYGASGTRESVGGRVQKDVLKTWNDAKEDAGKIINDITSRYNDAPVQAGNFIAAVNKPVGAATTKAVSEATVDPLVTEAKKLLADSRGILTVRDLRSLRDKYGRALEPGLMKNVNDAQVEQLWKAVTTDIEDVIKEASPQDLAALKGANKDYRAAMDDFRQNFKKLVGTGEMPVSSEKAYDLLLASGSEKARADLDEFRHVWNALTPDTRGRLASTVLARMGSVDKGQGVSLENFQLGTFLREYRGLNPEAKGMLFGQNKQLSSQLDDLVAVNTRIQDKINRLVSTSKSGTGLIFAGQGLHGFGGLAAMMIDPLTGFLSLGGPYVAAELLTRPAAVKGLIRSLEPIERMIDANLRAVPAIEAIDALRPQKDQTPPQRNIPRFQAGGRPTPGQPAIVGEGGPELFVPDPPGTIIPNQTASAVTLPGPATAKRTPPPDPAVDTFAQRYGSWGDIERLLEELRQQDIDKTTIMPGSPGVDELGHRGTTDPNTGYSMVTRI